MSEPKDIKVNIVADGDNVTIRTGQALTLKEPVQICLSGTIKSISEFLTKRKPGGYKLQEIDQKRAVVIVNRQAMSIQLLLDPQSPYGTTITGNLEMDERLKPFHINESRTFTREELVKLLRFNRSAFLDLDKHTQLLAAYQAFKAKTKAEMDAESDTRGNKKFGFQKDVSTNLPDDFILSLPIFKGEEGVNFRVEICLDVTDGGARFWFESVELKELTEELRDQLIDEQLEFCAEFPIIEK